MNKKNEKRFDDFDYYFFFGFYFIRSFAHLKRHFTSDIHDLI